MAKYSNELVNEMLTMIEEDNYTIAEICRMSGINRATFYEWKATKPEFADALKDAFVNRKEKIRLLARQSLRMKLDGYSWREKKTVFVPDEFGELVIKEVVETEKYCPPDISAIKYVLAEEKAEEQEMESKFSMSEPEEEEQGMVYETYDPGLEEELMILERRLQKNSGKPFKSTTKVILLDPETKPDYCKRVSEVSDLSGFEENGVQDTSL